MLNTRQFEVRDDFLNCILKAAKLTDFQFSEKWFAEKLSESRLNVKFIFFELFPLETVQTIELKAFLTEETPSTEYLLLNYQKLLLGILSRAIVNNRIDFIVACCNSIQQFITNSSEVKGFLLNSSLISILLTSGFQLTFDQLLGFDVNLMDKMDNNLQFKTVKLFVKILSCLVKISEDKIDFGSYSPEIKAIFNQISREKLDEIFEFSFNFLYNSFASLSNDLKMNIAKLVFKRLIRLFKFSFDFIVFDVLKNNFYSKVAFTKDFIKLFLQKVVLVKYENAAYIEGKIVSHDLVMLLCQKAFEGNLPVKYTALIYNIIRDNQEDSLSLVETYIANNDFIGKLKLFTKIMKKEKLNTVLAGEVSDIFASLSLELTEKEAITVFGFFSSGSILSNFTGEQFTVMKQYLWAFLKHRLSYLSDSASCTILAKILKIKGEYWLNSEEINKIIVHMFNKSFLVIDKKYGFSIFKVLLRRFTEIERSFKELSHAILSDFRKTFEELLLLNDLFIDHELVSVLVLIHNSYNRFLKTNLMANLFEATIGITFRLKMTKGTEGLIKKFNVYESLNELLESGGEVLKEQWFSIIKVIN